MPWTFDFLLLRRPFLLGSLLIVSALVLVRDAIFSYLSEGKVHLHWLYIAVGGLLALTGVELFAFGALKKVLLMLKDRQAAREGAPKGAARPEPARR